MKKLLKKLFSLLPKHIWPARIYYDFVERERQLTEDLQSAREALQNEQESRYFQVTELQETLYYERLSKSEQINQLQEELKNNPKTNEALIMAQEELVSAENTVLSDVDSIFFFHDGAGNHGCEAIVRSLCKLCGFKPFLLSTKKHEDIRFGLDKITGHIKRSTLSATELEGHRFNDHTIALSIGGDNYCYSDFGRDMLAGYGRLFLSKGVKTALVGCSIEPQVLEDENVLNDLDSLSLIVAREKITYEALLAKGISRNTHLVPDSAFALDTEYAKLPEGFDPQNTVGINFSNLIIENGKLVLDNVEALIEYILNETKFNIALIPHVAQETNDDIKILKSLFDRYQTYGRMVLIENNNCQVLKGYIARCRLFIGARTHAVIAAYSSCVPAVALGYSVKSIGIARDVFGTEQNYVVPVQDMQSTDEFKNAFIWLCEHEQDIRQYLHNTMPEYSNQTQKLAELIDNLKSENPKVIAPLANQKECVGCGNCASICPAGAATMMIDSAGFSVRKIDYLKCTHCEACKAACLMGSAASSPYKPIKVFAAVNENMAERCSSSSGGIFVKLAMDVLDKGGVVYGAAFDETLTLRHIRVTNADDIKKLMGSKYLESALGNVFSAVKSDAEAGKQVLFSGTPCQIKSLKLFSRKDYDNVLLVDLICHGVPSPEIFEQRKSQMEQKHGSKLTEVYFRDKLSGWTDYSVTYIFEDGQRMSVRHNEDEYMQLFLQDKILRESCYNCHANNYLSGSDITLGDYWNGQVKHPNFEDDKGISAVLINSEKGAAFFESIDNVKKEIADLEHLEMCNQCLVKSVEKPWDRVRFMKYNYIPELQGDAVQEPPVSIVTSSYNDAVFLERYFTELAKQTYNNFEIIFVDDGSTDDTKQVVERWIRRFSQIRPTVKIHYIYQEHGFAAKGYETGIKRMTGQFFSCLDSDDFFDPNYITEHIKMFLSMDCNIVQCNSYVGQFNQDNEFEVQYTTFDRLEQKGGNLFYNAITEKDFFFFKYMTRTSAFDRFVSNREIYHADGGQNYQLLMPVLYHNHVYTIEHPLFYYVLREDSHSHCIDQNKDHFLKRITEQENTLLNTIRRMRIPEEVEVIGIIKEKYENRRREIELMQ